MITTARLEGTPVKWELTMNFHCFVDMSEVYDDFRCFVDVSQAMTRPLNLVARSLLACVPLLSPDRGNLSPLFINRSNSR